MDRLSPRQASPQAGSTVPEQLRSMTMGIYGSATPGAAAASVYTTSWAHPSAVLRLAVAASTILAASPSTAITTPGSQTGAPMSSARSTTLNRTTPLATVAAASTGRILSPSTVPTTSGSSIAQATASANLLPAVLLSLHRPATMVVRPLLF